MAHIRLEAALETSEKNSSLPTRIVHATKSFVSSVLNRNNHKLSKSVAQRFEWYADGAGEFLKFIEFVKNLFAGKELYHKIVRGNMHPLFQLWLHPIHNEVHGTDVNLIFIQHDGTPEGNICFSLIVQLSESTDIVGIALKCLQLCAPHFKCTFENIRNELAHLPTQDFSWGHSIYSYHKKHWDKFHSIMSQSARPNPFCCKQRDRHEKQKTSLFGDLISQEDCPYLKAGIYFVPHGSLDDILSENRSSEIMAMILKEQCLHTDITLEQLEEIMLPKAIDFFRQNAEAMVHQMLWKSEHGFALIQVGMRTRRTFGRASKRKLLQGHDEELTRIRIRRCHWIDLWVTHLPARMQRSLMNWMKKEKEILLAAPQLRMEF
ncbi:hypothetical protein HU200_016387 [Digitaria exilis]|uniref:Uncharacterized protein n=1 Tax=Digitaria exilis TaxID=1010633 RepID=A0A835F8M4_9POAL|nr:hypothetical protein HU200_016387 [Digitaria exilis]